MKTVKHIPTNTKRRPGIKLSGVKIIVTHDTHNINTTALQNVDYFIRSANEVEASAHIFVDDINIIECIPLDEVAYHVRGIAPQDNILFGVNANQYGLGIELCYFTDVQRSKRAYSNYVGLIRELCSTYKVDPQKYVTGHYQLDPGRKTDPMNAFKIIGKTWEQFIADLNIPTEEEQVPVMVPISKVKKITEFLLNI